MQHRNDIIPTADLPRLCWSQTQAQTCRCPMFDYTGSACFVRRPSRRFKTFLLASIVSASNRSYAFCLSCTGVHTGFCLRFRGRISNAYRDAGTLSMASLSRFRVLRPCERSRDGAIYYCR